MFGGFGILVIEVKYKPGNAYEQLNAMAQVIGECDGTHYGLSDYFVLISLSL